MMTEFRQMAVSSPEARAMGDDFMSRFAEGGQTATKMRWDYYDFVVDTTIAGVSAGL